MGKKNNDIYDLRGVDPVKAITEHTNKNGKLRGSKKEKAALRSICEHHTISKKGKKVRARLDVHDRNCTCKICQEKFSLDFYSDQQYDKAYAPYKAILSQGKLLAVATNADLKTQQEICELNLRADRYKKIYGNLRKAGEKRQKIKDKKKKENKKPNGTFGAWQTTK